MFTKADIEKYFVAEKQAALMMLVIGAIAVLAAIAFFFFMRSSFWKGAAIPLLLLGIFEIMTGYGIRKSSDEERVQNVYAFDMNPQALKDHELPRMKKMEQMFVNYRWAELVLAVAGLVLVFLFRSNPDRSFWYGLGIALAIQGFLLFTLETAAANRAKEYTAKLVAWVSARAQ